MEPAVFRRFFLFRRKWIIESISYAEKRIALTLCGYRITGGAQPELTAEMKCVET